jgi:hypothetical protein
MKPSKIFWGVFFLGLGFLLLLKNFTDIEFYLPEIRKFWPLLLIAAGVVYLTKNLIARNIIAGFAGFAVAFFLLTITSSFVHLPKEIFSNAKHSKNKSSLVINNIEPYDTNIKFVNLEFSGGAGTYIVSSKDTNLLSVRTDRSGRKFSVTKLVSNGKSDIKIEMEEFNIDLKDTSFANLVELSLNQNPLYEKLNFHIGAADFELNISNLKFKNLSLEVGASSTKIHLPKPVAGNSEVNIDCGASSIEIFIPKDAQVKILNEMALSDNDLPVGFSEKGDAIYSDNYTGTGDVIIIKIDGGVSSLKLKRE